MSEFAQWSGYAAPHGSFPAGATREGGLPRQQDADRRAFHRQLAANRVLQREVRDRTAAADRAGTAERARQDAATLEGRPKTRFLVVPAGGDRVHRSAPSPVTVTDQTFCSRWPSIPPEQEAWRSARRDRIRERGTQRPPRWRRRRKLYVGKL